ncbi:hypothetical protein BO83DRAFT_398726 [Aspergillus eucalypticola CBS 122712]|uniref:AT DNA binding protein n=1 Tax=Aspergillus eucalypticola (strain CBS 122712 / IBT 29274) TaxID=1448314 RepID=A0A317VMY0_ASPEC|nr:uncharacterized protein BO83DRAFT_398726 [Aspergillus eucalypticola CBS 122712]PWY73290.1 hypothetical protein BO83DRAFT_398726 [Aspergillus eucalypticola CBS 122712]
MSNQPERPWTEEEKYTLLTEILKKARVPSSHLVRMIRDFNITPSWADIPLPPGRSLNSCQIAFCNMLQHVQLSVTHSLGSIPPQPHEPSVPATVPLESSSVLRKRPLIPSDRAIRAPRAIQPRPATSTASYSSESGASALLSPSSESVTARGEPPRKRGRPSKAESERRKAAAEARGETYPPPRRSGSHKLKVSSTPTSPSGVAPGLPSFSPQASSSRPPELPRHEMHYVPPPGRPISLMGPSSDERPRDMPNQDIGSSMRELPRPDLRQTLPSPGTLHLGHRDTPLIRREPGVPFEPLPPDRHPFSQSNRRSLIHPTSRYPDEPPTPASDLPISKQPENRPE